MSTIKKYIPASVKSVLKTVRTFKNKVLARFYWPEVIKSNPEKHANYDMKRQKQHILRAVDLHDPIYFNEKMLWLKYNYYNNSPLVAQCFNKYYVRKYIESKGLGHILNELYGAWDSVDEIPWNTLPDEFVMKVAKGYGDHVFRRKNQVFDLEEAKRKLSKSIKQFSYFYYMMGDLFVEKTPQKIICERMLESSFGCEAPEDYKFYCFNGKPLYVEIMMDRNTTKAYKYIEKFLDINFNDRHELEGEATPGTIKKPECYNEMVKIAEVLSRDFPFVRVDLYVQHGKPIFGELTFTPYHKQTEQSLVELGNALDITNVEKYCPILGKSVGM